MKNSWILLVTLTIALPALASEKVCFWKSGHTGSKGDRFTARISKSRIKIVNSELWEGTYPREKQNVHGKDGITYFSYDMGSNDGANSALVDEALLQDETKGLIKLRNRGEGFSQDTYFCRDEQF